MYVFGIWLVLCVKYSYYAFHYQNWYQLWPVDSDINFGFICFSTSLWDMGLVVIVQIMSYYHVRVIALSREHRFRTCFDCWSNSCHRVPFLYFLQCWIDDLNSHFDFNLLNIYLYVFSCCFLLGSLLSWLKPNEYALTSSFACPFSLNNRVSCCNYTNRCTVARSIRFYSLDVGIGWWGCPRSWNC